jgi:beta-glucosidase
MRFLQLSKSKIFILTILIAVGIGIGGIIFLYKQLPSPQHPGFEIYAQDEFRKSNYPYLDKSLPIDQRVDDLLNRMTTDEKIGQMALVEKNSIHDPLDVSRYGLGGVMSGFGGKPEPNTPQGWLDMVNGFESSARYSRLGIPILYGVDTNHGHSNVPGATIFPHFIGLGATSDPDLVRRTAQATSEEMLATNIYWSFSPNLDVVSDIRWGRTYETFGSDPNTVAELGKAYVEGLSVLSTAKHYLGNGSMEWGSSKNINFAIDQGVTRLDEDTLISTHLPPFKAAIEGGAKSVMAGLNTWEDKKMAANSYLLTDVLKKELNFQGFVVSDWYGVYEISISKYKSLVTAVNAGVDMIMLPFDYKSFMYYMEKAVQSGDISEERLNDATRRILLVKFELGLFDRDVSNNPDLSVLGSQANRDIAREAVRKSLVLLKNTGETLPLSKSVDRIVVAGSAADNIGRQSGAWTVEWQGIDGNWIPGTTILAGIKAAVSDSTDIEYNEAGNFSASGKRADIGIVVVGEKPYAEGWGDLAHPALSKDDLEVIEKTKARSEKLVVIIVSGRPLDIKGLHNDWNAVVAAWLPGSEGQGVADVLFGDYPFTGKLPVTWEL